MLLNETGLLYIRLTFHESLKQYGLVLVVEGINVDVELMVEKLEKKTEDRAASG